MDLMTTAQVAFSLGVALQLIAARLVRSGYERRLWACALSVLATTGGILLITAELPIGAADSHTLVVLFIYQAVGLCVMATFVAHQKVVNGRRDKASDVSRRPWTLRAFMRALYSPLAR